MVRRSERTRPQRGGGQRGPITAYTKGARRRLLRTLFGLAGLTHYLLLTYPDPFPRNGAAAKAHLERFTRWLRQQGIGGVWVLEFQPGRGAPHFHLLVNRHIEWGPTHRRWAESIDADSLAATATWVTAEPIRSQLGVRWYLAKKRTKEVPDGFEGPGKFYGVFGPVSRLRTIERDWTDMQIARVIRAIRTLDRKRWERAGRRARVDNGRWSRSYWSWTEAEWAGLMRLMEKGGKGAETPTGAEMPVGKKNGTA